MLTEWSNVRAQIVKMIEADREALEVLQAETMTAHLRGRIAALRQLLAEVERRPREELHTPHY